MGSDYVKRWVHTCINSTHRTHACSQLSRLLETQGRCKVNPYGCVSCWSAQVSAPRSQQLGRLWHNHSVFSAIVGALSVLHRWSIGICTSMYSSSSVCVSEWRCSTEVPLVGEASRCRQAVLEPWRLRTSMRSSSHRAIRPETGSRRPRSVPDGPLIVFWTVFLFFVDWTYGETEKVRVPPGTLMKYGIFYLCTRYLVPGTIFRMRSYLTPLEPQSRFGDKLLEIWIVFPENGTAVLKELKVRTSFKFHSCEIPQVSFILLALTLHWSLSYHNYSININSRNTPSKQVLRTYILIVRVHA